MRKDLLIQLCNADAIASNEQEVRSLLFSELSSVSDDIIYDHLGSIIFHKKGESQQSLKLMFIAHMDEVGFLVRHITDIGFIYLIAIGGVLDKSKEMQKVRITTQDGNKIVGILNVTRNEMGNIKDIYVDIGVECREAVQILGIEIGDMVCFASSCEQMNNSKTYIGKAMDDRCGCFVIMEAMKGMAKEGIKNDLYFCGSSSEEVGARGGKTAVYQVNPDIVIAIDVANNPRQMERYTNHRMLGKGCMIVHYDKTMLPNKALLRFVKDTAEQYDIAFQKDMFSGGGTDIGKAHLLHNGKLAIVLGIPLRYCHGAWSIVHEDDLNSCIALVVTLAKSLKKEVYEKFIDFQGGIKE